MSTDPNSFLMGGGKSAKFDKHGDSITGVITAEPELRQQTDFKTGKALFWDNGDPIMQMVVRLQTEQREDSDDDGIRAVYLKGGFKNPTTQKAVADAVRAAGAKGLAVGGTLTLTYTGDGQAQSGGYPPKFYSASYTPPSSSFLSGQPATPTATSTALPTPAPVAPQQAAPPAPAAPAGGMVTLPDGSQITAEVAALLAQVQTASA